MKRNRTYMVVENGRCPTCQYRIPRGNGYLCNYCEITGKSRGCAVENCMRYIEGNRIKSNEEKQWRKKAINKIEQEGLNEWDRWIEEMMDIF